MRQLDIFSLEEIISLEGNSIRDFKNRKVKAKSIFFIKEIPKKEAYEFVKKFHYLSDAKFFSKFQYGLYLSETNELMGVSTFSNPQGISAMKSWFGLENSDQSVLELSRLCMHPTLNGTNATSYLLGNSIKLLKKHDIKAVITLADNNRHVGSIYQVCNFKYYGLTDKKTDFYCEDGRKNPRGKTKDLRGVWLERSRKHRYAFIIDKKLKINYEEMKRPNIEDYNETNICKGCKGLGFVIDDRFNVKYECPLENDSSKGLKIL